MSATNPASETLGGHSENQSRENTSRVSEALFEAVADTRDDRVRVTCFAITDDVVSSHLLGRPWRPSESWPELAVQRDTGSVRLDVALYLPARPLPEQPLRVTVTLLGDRLDQQVHLERSPDDGRLPAPLWTGLAPPPPWGDPELPVRVRVRVES